MVKNIYYVEDDENIAFGVRNYLQGKNLCVSTFRTATEAKSFLKRHLPSLVIIDWNLPDGTGDGLCRWIRSKWKELPVLFLTVRGDTSDIVQGFEYGADDYIVKPFELEVLYSRICAILRRAGDASGSCIICGSIVIDKTKMQVFSEEEKVPLSAMEYQLLLILMKNKNCTVTRQRLLESIWDVNENYVNDNTLTVTMKRLREKLHNPSCIKTIRSFGYRMEDMLE
jgi:DNA-binding response OmpR family regulator